MKKFTLLFSFILLISLSFYSCEQSQLESSEPEATDFVESKPMNRITNPDKIRACGEQECFLKAGRNGTNIGTVTVSNDDANLYVTVYSSVGFKTSGEDAPQYLKIWVGAPSDLPTERPPSGHFQFKTDEINTGNDVTYQIPYSELGINPGDQCEPHEFSVIVHVDAGSGDTAYGGCEEFGEPNGPTDKNKWWYYMDYYTQCCECWCSFGFDYQSPEVGKCLSMPFEGENFIFWSDGFNFNDMKDVEYTLPLIVNSTVCEPMNTQGEMVDKLAWEVGSVVIKAYQGDDGKPYFDVIYTLNDEYKGYNIQLDFYNGADRIPEYNLQMQEIIMDDLHMLYQHKLNPGEVRYDEFKGLPWLADGGESKITYFAFHAAIGDCPMPSLQNPM